MTTTSRKRRSAHTPAANGSKWIRPPTRWAIYHRDNFKCLYCQRGYIEIADFGLVDGVRDLRSLARLTLDHVRPVVANGRTNAPSNLVTCCLSCNSRKQGCSTRAWYKWLREQGVNVYAMRLAIARSLRKPIDRAIGLELAGGRR